VTGQHERPGSLRFRRLVRLFSQEEGRVTQLALFEGDQVEAGQLLVELDDELLRAEADKAIATREQKALDFQRLLGLRNRQAVSEDELAQARTALAIAQADERLLQARLELTRIRAPFAGVVTERRIEPGDFVARNTHLLTLADPDSLVAEVLVSELILPHLALGDPVSLRIDALGSVSFAGEILRIHPALDQATRQAVVEVALKPIPEGARAGQFVRARLKSAAVERILVPFRALLQDRDGELLWLVGQDGKAERRAVRSGLRIANQIEILEGLTPGERVITRGFLGLTESKTVRVVEDAR
jgi:RND family efflux transporter MFP subunit